MLCLELALARSFCMELALARSDFILDMMDFNSDFALIFFS